MCSLIRYLIGSFLCLSVGKASHSENEETEMLYEEFKRTYNKVYTNEEDGYRFQVFRDNLMSAKELQVSERGTAQYGVTQFSDLTSEEFETFYLGLKIDKTLDVDESVPHETVFPADEENFDWREKGAVGPVLNQGRCGSCWAFSTVGNIEGQWFLKKGELLQLSEQQLVDCDHVDSGCRGGYPPYTYIEIRKMGGLELFADYPYYARQGQCHLDPKRIRAYINASIMISKDETVQRDKLRELGPLSSALNANPLQHYKRGIMHPETVVCPVRGINHAVLTVGYGVDSGIPYWLVKNSWGEYFGENGYFRIFRGDKTCGINQLVTSAIVK